MISGMYGEYYNYPLRTQPRQKWTDEGFSGLPGDSVMMTTLVFRICNPRYANMDDYRARKPTIEWECMACVEAGNKWIGADPQPHCEAHQMGFDFAVMWLEKQAIARRLADSPPKDDSQVK